MSGGGSSPAPPPPPPPVARIEAPIEVDDAKKRVKSRAKGANGQRKYDTCRGNDEKKSNK